MDTVRNEHLIHGLVIHGHHVLCTGDTGTGKSVTAKKKLLFGMGPKFSSIMLNFSAQTSANQASFLITEFRMTAQGIPVGTHLLCETKSAFPSLT